MTFEGDFPEYLYITKTLYTIRNYAPEEYLLQLTSEHSLDHHCDSGMYQLKGTGYRAIALNPTAKNAKLGHDETYPEVLHCRYVRLDFESVFVANVDDYERLAKERIVIPITEKQIKLADVLAIT